jgi:hypothetical protein
MARVVMSFALDSQRDRRILHYLEGLPGGQRSKAIRDALNAHIEGEAITLRHVYQAVRELELRIGSEYALTGSGSPTARSDPPEDEPADVAANLNGLGL